MQNLSFKSTGLILISTCQPDSRGKHSVEIVPGVAHTFIEKCKEPA